MATLVLQTVGSSIGGPVGGMVGAVIGGAIDARLFGPGDQTGPRLTDQKITTSTYGNVIPLAYGPENRLSGNIIWASDLNETEIETGGKGGPTVTEYSYSISCAVAIVGREVNSLKRIWANNKVIYDVDGVNQFSPPNPIPNIDPVIGQIVSKYFDDPIIVSSEEFRGTHSVFDELTFYPGNATQDPDPLMESFEGVGNVPGYRHIAYVVIKDLQLADFGNRLPNFEFEIEADESITTGSVISDLMSRASLPNTSMFGLSNDVRGYTIARQSTGYAAVAPLAVAYDFEATEQDGQIRFVRKSRGMKGSVELNEMNARTSSSIPSNKSPITYMNQSDVGMPNEVTISFKDPNIDYQINTQRANRRLGSAINKISQELPLVISATDARQVSERLLWGAWSNKKSISFSVNDTWVKINPGDILGIPAFGQTVPMKVIPVTRGDNGIIQMEAVYEDPEIYNSQAIGIDAQAFSQTVNIPGDTTWVPIDAPLLRDTDPDSGFYWAATGENSGWRGATIKRSTDNGESYNRVTDVAVRNPIGNISGTLGSGPTEIFDRLNTLTVTLTSSKSNLESVSELLVLNGANAAWVGPAEGGVGEIIQFATATLVSGTTYTLSNLLRGRLGSEHAVNNHGPNEVFVLLQRGSLGTSDFGISDWDIGRLYKPISFLTDELHTASQSFTNTGVRAKPLSVSHVRGSRNGSNDLTITWMRRTRKRVPGLGKGDVPLGETTESYEIDIVNETSVLRTITATTESATYTAAQQTSDGLTPGDLVSLDVYQISETRGRGYPRRAII